MATTRKRKRIKELQKTVVVQKRRPLAASMLDHVRRPKRKGPTAEALSAMYPLEPKR